MANIVVFRAEGRSSPTGVLAEAMHEGGWTRSHGCDSWKHHDMLQKSPIYIGEKLKHVRSMLAFHVDLELSHFLRFKCTLCDEMGDSGSSDSFSLSKCPLEH